MHTNTLAQKKVRAIYVKNTQIHQRHEKYMYKESYAEKPAARKEKVPPNKEKVRESKKEEPKIETGNKRNRTRKKNTQKNTNRRKRLSSLRRLIERD
jgi:hypothetical protein